MHLTPFKGRNKSGRHKLNLLFHDGRAYIMDNHLAAAWCWVQRIDVEKQYNLLHIDRHYDLLESQIDWWIEALSEQNIDLKTISIKKLLSIQYQHKAVPSGIQLFAWDNYLPIFHRLFPKLLDDVIFATHKDGGKMEGFEMSEVESHKLVQNLSYWVRRDNSKKWIVNLDIDYFFTGSEEEYFQLYTDDFVLKIAEEIKQAWENIEVFTIALSPEMCGGWENSERVAKLITDHLGIAWSLESD